MLSRFCIFLLFLLVPALSLAAQSGALSSGFYDDTVPLISYVDTERYTDSAGLYMETYTLASYASFSFVGEGFSFYGHAHELSPDLIVCVDAVCQPISLYAAPESGFYGLIFTISGLAYGLHDVTLEAVVTVGDSLFLVDAIEIPPYIVVIAEATEDPTIVEWLPLPDSSQIVRFRYEMSAGDLLSSSLLFILLLVGLGYIIIRWGWNND